MSKYLKFEKDGNIILVKNKKYDTVLGTIVYYKRWKRLVFYPIEGTLFDGECLIDIIKQLKNS